MFNWQFFFSSRTTNLKLSIVDIHSSGSLGMWYTCSFYTLSPDNVFFLVMKKPPNTPKFSSYIQMHIYALSWIFFSEVTSACIYAWNAINIVLWSFPSCDKYFNIQVYFQFNLWGHNIFCVLEHWSECMRLAFVHWPGAIENLPSSTDLVQLQTCRKVIWTLPIDPLFKTHYKRSEIWISLQFSLYVFISRCQHHYFLFIFFWWKNHVIFAKKKLLLDVS